MTEQHNDAAAAPSEIFQSLGSITRQLHDTLHELGYAAGLQGAVTELPDARSRLEYIVRLTGEAADKVLNRVDAAKAEQEAVRQHSQQLLQTIQTVPGLKWAMPELVEWSQKIAQSTEQTDAHLTEIMLAQDFHDLTGQVIKRVVALASTLENQLLQVLLQAAPQAVAAGQPAPASQAATAPSSTTSTTLAGPVVNAQGRADVVSNQQDVDDLLASLGF